jgi:hypothetical protein
MTATKNVSVRLTADEVDMVDAAARKQGMSRAEFLRHRVLGAQASTHTPGRPQGGGNRSRQRPVPADVTTNFKERDR